jgi:hypothetical protein
MVACGVVVAQTRRVSAPQADNVPLALTHVAVIDATGSPAQLEMTVIISGGRITGLGPAAKVKVPAHARVIDASKKFLIPGLWDITWTMASFTRHIPHAPIKKPFSRCSLPMASLVCAT